MTYEMKSLATRTIKEALEIEAVNGCRISKIVTERLNEAFPTGWVCIVGRSFLASISHEPRTFLRASNENFIFLLYKSIA